jgi:hypothetical protein
MDPLRLRPRSGRAINRGDQGLKHATIIPPGHRGRTPAALPAIPCSLPATIFPTQDTSAR